MCTNGSSGLSLGSPHGEFLLVQWKRLGGSDKWGGWRCNLSAAGWGSAGKTGCCTVKGGILPRTAPDTGWSQMGYFVVNQVDSRAENQKCQLWPFFFILFCLGGGGGCIVECAMKQAHSAYLNGEEIMKCSCYTVDFQQTLITTFCTSLPWRRLRLDWRGVIVWNIYLSSIIHAGICQKKKKKTSDFAKL